MKLIDLKPRWITRKGRRVMFIFKDPMMPQAKDWLSCKSAPMKVSEQYALISEQCPDICAAGEIHAVVPTRPDAVWSIEGEFENLTVAPSIDASASGNWHGHIQGGLIR